MNNQTQEALKMAIEALDTLMMEKGSVYQQAINACKEALEDEEARDKARAWLDAVENGKPNEAAQLTLQQGREILKQMKALEQPAQEPLSDDEINELWKESCEDVRGLNLGFTTQQHYFAWLIEQAHGIGVKE